jgi:hypothetical protein
MQSDPALRLVMTKVLQPTTRSEQRGPSPEVATPLHALSFTRSQAEAFRRDPSQGLSRITSTYKRAVQRFDQGSITRKELKQLANDLRNYAHDIRQSGQRSAQRATEKIESMALGLDKRARTDLGPSSVRPISEIFNPELETVLRKVASNRDVQKALSTQNADNAYHQLRHGSHYTTTPSGATVIFLASLESGRRALVEQAERTNCEAHGSVVAMTPREGLTLITHYLPQPKGQQIILNGPLHINGDDVEKNNFVNRLISCQAAIREYLDTFRGDFKTAAITENREDLAHSNEVGDAALRSVLGMSKNCYELSERLHFLGINTWDLQALGSSKRDLPADLFRSIDPAEMLQHVSPALIKSLATSADIDLNDPQAYDAIAKELLSQPWSTIVAPDQVVSFQPSDPPDARTSKPDKDWTIQVVRSHVHPWHDHDRHFFSKREVAELIQTRGISVFITAAISETEKRVEQLRQDIRKHSDTVQRARDLVQEGDLVGALSILNENLERGNDRDALGRQPLSLRFHGAVTHSHVNSEIAIHEAILSNFHKQIEKAGTRLNQLQRVTTVEDCIELFFAQPRGYGTFQESEADVLTRRADETNPALNQHGPSIEIIENPFGSLYAVADRGNAITNLRYEGPGERQTPSIGLDRWLDGDRLTASEIVRSYDAAMATTAQPLHQVVIHDQNSGVRRFALPPHGIVSWLIMNRRADIEESLDHPLTASKRVVADQEHLFVDWPESGTLQPENIRKVTALLQEHGVDSDDITTIIAQLDRFYRTAPDYETRYPLHATMPDTCIKDPGLMERYLSVAERIAEQGETLPPELSVILQSLHKIKWDKPLRVARGIELLGGMLDLLTTSTKLETAADSVRQILSSPKLIMTLQRAIEGELDRPELFPQVEGSDEQAAVSPPWTQRFKAFVNAETEKEREIEAHRARALAWLNRPPSPPHVEEHIESPQETSDIHRPVSHSVRAPSELTYPPEYASELRRDGKFDPEFAQEILRKCLRNVVEKEGVIDPDDFNFTPPEDEHDLKEHQEATRILKELLATEFNQFGIGAKPVDPYHEATRRIQDTFNRTGYIDLQQLLASYDGSIKNQNVELHLAIAKEIAGRLITNIPPLSSTTQVNSDEATLSTPSYSLIREELFARINDEDFPQQVQELVNSLYERDKVVRFWDLAMGAGNDPVVATKYNDALLRSLVAIPDNHRANWRFNYFVAQMKS